MIEQLFSLILDTVKNPQTWGGVLIGGIGVYTAMAKGILITPREAAKDAELEGKNAEIKELTQRVDDLEEKLKPLDAWVSHQMEKKFNETDQFESLKP